MILVNWIGRIVVYNLSLGIVCLLDGVIFVFFIRKFVVYEFGLLLYNFKNVIVVMVFFDVFV